MLPRFCGSYPASSEIPNCYRSIIFIKAQLLSFFNVTLHTGNLKVILENLPLSNLSDEIFLAMTASVRTREDILAEAGQIHPRGITHGSSWRVLRQASAGMLKPKWNWVAHHNSYFSKEMVDLLKNVSPMVVPRFFVVMEKLFLYENSHFCFLSLLVEDATGCPLESLHTLPSTCSWEGSTSAW